jgi:hypothetical protein
MIWLLASSGSLLALGDAIGHHHLVKVQDGPFAHGVLREPIMVQSIQQIRSVISDLDVPVARTIQLGSKTLWVAYAERQWFVIAG